MSHQCGGHVLIQLQKGSALFVGVESSAVSSWMLHPGSMAAKPTALCDAG